MRLTVGAAFFPPRISRALIRYGIAVTAMGAVVILTFLFWKALGHAIPTALVFFAIAVTSWYAGRNAGVAAALLGIVATDLIAPSNPHPWTEFFLYSRLFSFTLFALMVSALRDAGDRYRRDQQRLLELERAARVDAEHSALLHQQVEDKLTVLVEASGALLTSLDSAFVLSRIMELAKRFVAADAYAIWRSTDVPGKWQLVSAEGLSDEYRKRFFEGVEEIALENREIVAIEDLSADPRFEPRREMYRKERICSLLMIALRIREEAPGAISFYYRTPHEFGPGNVRVATALANLAGSALLLAELYEEQIRLRADAQDVTEALHYKNDELQQFAYVVSHDLQEPLRMINGYAKLLAKRYAGRLDRDADEFLGFLVGGVERMQTLIRDLLAYSRVVNTDDRPQEYVPLESVLDDVLQNLRVSIEKESAVVTHGALPKLLTWRTQMTQLLQNLIGNALKYRGPDTPLIHLQAENHGKEWVFSVHDNGIGIEERHYDRIFGIFKRLHGPEYPGTGIGLAISKRIVERHRGRIWLESKLGEGSVFYFTLPADIVQAD